jgi:N-sulfoglucosamine sulfohydrolase
MKPNILYIHSHDTGRYVQPYGYAVNTPNIQRLAEKGVLFRQAFCANPTCSPSRACLLTGMYAHSNGMVGLVHRGVEGGGSRLSDPRRHIASTLRDNGYVTARVGAHHVSHAKAWSELGYTRLLDDELIGAHGEDWQERCATTAAHFIAERAFAEDDSPFFLACGFARTHRTPAAGEQAVQWHNGAESPLGDPRYVKPPAPLPDSPVTRRDFADYCVSAQRLDALMGTVFDALEHSGLADDTLVICTTDHGIAYPFMKCNLTDHGTGVMLILCGPDGFSGGKCIDALVSHIDIFPTVCELAGITAPDWLQGVSLLPTVTGAAPGAGETTAVRDEVFAEVNYHAAHEPKRSVRTARWKYIRRYEVLDHPVMPNCDPSESRELLVAQGWRQRPQERERLYDLLFDPNEACNLAADPGHSEVLDDMRARLDRWMRETDDPLLSNETVPAWPGSIVNTVDQLSPTDPMSGAKEAGYPVRGGDGR